MTTGNTPEHAVGGGWRGYINGAVRDTDTTIQVTQITVRLDNKLAHALCNLLTDGSLNVNHSVEDSQRKDLSTFGAALGRMIDHPSANNGGREVIK